MMPKPHIKWRDIFFLSIGAIWTTVLNNWSYFSFDKSIGIADLFTAVIGGYIGLYVGSKLTSKVSSDRAEKDLIISEIKIVRSNFLKLISSFETNRLLFNETINLFKITGQNIASIKETLGYCKYENELDADIFDILVKFRTLYRKVTGISPVKDLINIPLVDLNSYITELRTINQNLNKFMIDINRAEK